MDAMIEEVARAARALTEGPAAVALGGSLAKGVADAHSDLDIYVFAESWLDDEARQACMAERLPRAVGVRSWSAPPAQAGTDFVLDGRPVEIWLRQIGPLGAIVEGAVRGVVNRRYVTWTPNGFYDHCGLADLTTLRVLEDEQGVLVPLLAAIKTYPSALKTSLVESGLASTRFWRNNFHLETALLRADGFYLQSLAQQVVVDLIQALFAANETHFPGDKKMEKHLSALAWQPADVKMRLDRVLLGQGADWRDRFATAFDLADEIAAFAGTSAWH